jgi:hypothetical protein
MCTVTIIPARGGVRVCVNRDESTGRPAGLPPRRLPDDAGIMPVDPVSGGTWVGASGAGFVAAVLNHNPGRRPAPPVSPGAASRGLVIPALLTAESLAAAADRARRLDTGRTPAFRLVLADSKGVLELTFGGAGAAPTERRLGASAPSMFASSGLGDDLVDGPRRRLFESMFDVEPDLWPHVQDAFHDHRWPGRGEVSVWMARAGARTVSRTTVEICDGAATMWMSTRRHADGGAGEPLRLPARAGAGA